MESSRWTRRQPENEGDVVPRSGPIAIHAPEGNEMSCIKKGTIDGFISALISATLRME